jgi:predicted CopG family antitoxin
MYITYMNVNYGIKEPQVEINLDNPIFVYYINVDGLSRQRAEELISQVKDQWSYSNVVTWIVPRQQGDTKIECVYDGRIRERSEELKELIEEINEKVDLMSQSSSFEDFKIIVRDWRLKTLLK